MFDHKHIIVLLDTEEDNSVAVDKAAILAEATKSKLTLLSCAYNGSLNSIHPSAENARNAFLSTVKDGLERLAQIAQNKGVATTTEAIWEKHSGAGLIAYLSTHPADLVIKATHHQNVIQRTFFSQTDWELIRKCPIPLLLCKAITWRQPINITAAVDPVGHLNGDDPSDDSIIGCANSISEALGGQVGLLHVYDPAPLMIYLDEPPVDSIHVGDELKNQHTSALAALAEKHNFGEASTTLEMGEPLHVIPNYLSSNSVDIVAMGAASQVNLKRWLLGHTAEKVLDKITIDILICK